MTFLKEDLFLGDVCQTPYGLVNRYSTQSAPVFVTSNDLDNDGILDLIVANADSTRG